MEWHSFSAMGTTVSVLSDAIVIDPARMLFESIEAKLSRFRPTSELSRVNCDPSAVIEVSEILADVLAAADDARCRTDGLVDPAVGRAVRDWGYDRTFFEVADLSMAPDAASGGISWAITGTTLERDPGVVLDLGGIAKGWTADLALAETDALAVNAGGDLCSRHPDLRVHVCDPWGGRAATVAVGIGGLATSSTVRRTWMVAGEPVHHLIDPRFGQPARTPAIQATAVAGSASLAEAAAKAMVLSGPGALTWSAARDWVAGGVVVWDDGSVFSTMGLEVAA